MEDKKFVLTVPRDTSYICTNIEPGRLPALLEKAVTVTDQPMQQDMLLLSALTACGYAMPNYLFAHGNPAHSYHPSLFTLVIAPPASGKGIMNLSRRLINPIHELRRSMPVAVMEGEELPERTAFVPSNCSSAAFLKLLVDNNGRGLMMETEADALTAAWKNDYANYSYAMRQAAEHETITKSRKKAGEAFLEVKEPELSVLLSGTLGQLAPLIGSRENGLASRFITYMAAEVFPFDERAIHGMSDSQENPAEALYDELGEQMLRLYKMLEKRERPVVFKLSDDHAEVMRGFFCDGYRLAMEDMRLPLSFAPVVKRMAAHVMRIGAVLSMLRVYENMAEGERLPDEVVCTDDDFRTMMLLAEQLLMHAGRTFLALPSEDESVAVAEKQPTKADQLLDVLPRSFTTAEAIEAGKEMGMAERTAKEYLAQMCKAKQIARVQKGRFMKI